MDGRNQGRRLSVSETLAKVMQRKWSTSSRVASQVCDCSNKDEFHEKDSQKCMAKEIVDRHKNRLDVELRDADTYLFYSEAMSNKDVACFEQYIVSNIQELGPDMRANEVYQLRSIVVLETWRLAKELLAARNEKERGKRRRCRKNIPPVGVKSNRNSSGAGTLDQPCETISDLQPSVHSTAAKIPGRTDTIFSDESESTTRMTTASWNTLSSDESVGESSSHMEDELFSTPFNNTLNSLDDYLPHKPEHDPTDHHRRSSQLDKATFLSEGTTATILSEATTTPMWTTNTSANSSCADWEGASNIKGTTRTSKWSKSRMANVADECNAEVPDLRKGRPSRKANTIEGTFSDIFTTSRRTSNHRVQGDIIPRPKREEAQACSVRNYNVMIPRPKATPKPLVTLLEALGTP